MVDNRIQYDTITIDTFRNLRLLNHTNVLEKVNKSIKSLDKINKIGKYNLNMFKNGLTRCIAIEMVQLNSYEKFYGESFQMLQLNSYKSILGGEFSNA